MQFSNTKALNWGNIVSGKTEEVKSEGWFKSSEVIFFHVKRNVVKMITNELVRLLKQAVLLIVCLSMSRLLKRSEIPKKMMVRLKGILRDVEKAKKKINKYIFTSTQHYNP